MISKHDKVIQSNDKIRLISFSNDEAGKKINKINQTTLKKESKRCFRGSSISQNSFNEITFNKYSKQNDNCKISNVKLIYKKKRNGCKNGKEKDSKLRSKVPNENQFKKRISLNKKLKSRNIHDNKQSKKIILHLLIQKEKV